MEQITNQYLELIALNIPMFALMCILNKELMPFM